MSIDKRLISTEAAVCTADTLDIFEDSSCVALYGLNYDASDASGNYDGTPSNVTFNAPGYIDHAASFNGSSNVDVGTINGLLTSKVSSSISLWFNTSEANPGNDNLFNTYTGSYFNYYVYLREAYGTLYVEYISRFGGNTNTIQVNTPNINDGNWHHVVAILDVPNLKHKLYIDGSFGAEGAISTSSASGSNGIIGSGIVGEIDQVRIFNKALSAAEVTTLYGEVSCKYTCTTDTNGFPASASSDLAAYWKFDNDATDETGSYNGTASNVTFDGGRYGQAANFNGSSSYINTGLTKSNWVSDLNSRNVDFSISLWANVDAVVGGDNTFLYIGNYNVYSPLYAAMIIDYRSSGSKIRFTHQSTYVESTSAISLDTWYHIVCARESGVIKLYINGVLDSSATPSADMQISSSAVATLGALYFSGTTHGELDGMLDQVRIYTKALSSAEVSSLYEDEHQCYIAVGSTDPFGDSSNIALYEFENNANDSLGSYNGTASNVTYSTDSIIRTYSASFNATNSYITLGSASSLVATDFTFSAWIKTTSTSTDLIVGTNVSPYYSKVAVRSEGDGRVRCLYGNYTSNESWFYSTFNTINNGAWHHIVYFINQTTAKLYIDGSLDATHTLTITPTTNGDLTLGTFYNDNNNSYTFSNVWDGTIDQVRIFDRQLNGDEVWKLYAEGAKG